MWVTHTRHTGTGMLEYGYRLLGKTPGLPVVIPIYWQSQTKKIRLEKSQIRDLKTKVESGWQGNDPFTLCACFPVNQWVPDLSNRSSEGKKLTAEDIWAWLKDVNSLNLILRPWKDQDSLKTIAKQKAHLQEILAAMGLGKGTKHGVKRGSFFSPSFIWFPNSLDSDTKTPP
jgi:hypothetical protein